ncbi:hypothetical protein KCG48_06700 [Proteiniclasticum sp. BAD-10]|uniref:Gram-positive cocci surface proteins LPxTG domain-containing protein n=1 Tax=Proteiniclasticum sediminis TaxID=2804028 RepID=A0A941HQ34_9CLOT|nr:SpaA isopeptide-forming pilin-related protein [Proteiniclasticum sediminis]MBR0576029.1 hypothetical protein [Proteiniclasticum sediminis]
MTKRKRKWLSWILTLMVLLQSSTIPVAAESGVQEDLTGQGGYLKIHETNGDYAGLGGPSKVLVTTPQGGSIPLVDNTFHDVPEGSRLQLSYVFHLEDGDGEGTLYQYHGGQYFDIRLPEGLEYQFPGVDAAKIYAREDGNATPWLLGTWAFTSSNVIRVLLSEEVSDHRQIWGMVGLEGIFREVTDGEESKTSFTLGSQEIFFTRALPPPPKITLEKEGRYDATTGKILWTVALTPPAGIDLAGYTLVDLYSANQRFASGSFLQGEAIIGDEKLDLSTMNTIRYTFPSGSTGKQVIQYGTTPVDFSPETGASSSSEVTRFTNEAYVARKGEKVTDSATAQVAVDWISKGGQNVTTPQGPFQRWSVQVTVPAGGRVEGAFIQDFLPPGLTLVEDAGYPITLKMGSSAPLNLSPGTGEGTYTYENTSAGGESVLTVRFPQGEFSGTAILTFHSRLTDKDTALNTNGTLSFTNRAGFGWKDMPVGGSLPQDRASVQVIGSGGLVQKNGGSTQDYRYPNSIRWTITVNRNAIPVKGAKISDTLPLGQRILLDETHPFVVKHKGIVVFQTAEAEAMGSLTSSDDFSRQFTYTLGDGEGAWTVEYSSTIVDENPMTPGDASGLDTLYANGDIRFGNTVTLSRTGETDISVTGTKTFRSQMLAKSVVESYNYATHIVKWKIAVNRNGLPLTGAVLRETLPEGMVLRLDENHPMVLLAENTGSTVNVVPSEGTSGSREFTVALGDLDTSYSLSFYAVLTDEALLNPWNGNKTFTNLATLHAEELKVPISATASVQVENPVITKGFRYTKNSDQIHWSVVINPGMLLLSGAQVVDQLHEGLELDTATLKLYEVGISPEGVVEESGAGVLVTDGYQVDLPTGTNGNTLTVKLPENRRTIYRLEFTTNILSDDLDFSNTVSLTGETGSPVGAGTAGRIVVQDLWSSGGSGSLSLTVHKVDQEGKPVPGAMYRLLNFKGQPVYSQGKPLTALTDAEGNAVFKNLPSWVFFAEEILPPVGYLRNPAIFGGQRLTENQTLETVNLWAEGEIQLSKTGPDGELLTGGTFRLSGRDALGQEVVREVAALNGMVEFTAVPLGEYTLVETKAPEGYLLTDEVILVSVGYNDDFTAVVVNQSKEVLLNEEDPHVGGSLEVKKTDVLGNPLSNALFGLYDEEEELLQTKYSDENGLVRFTGLSIGTYHVRELEAPQGYELSKTEAVGTVTRVKKTVKGDPYIFINEKTPLPKNSSIQLFKKDSITGRLLYGAEFELLSEEGEVVASGITDESGSLFFPALEAGEYLLRETRAPEGYVLLEEDLSLQVKEGEKIVLTVANDPEITGLLPSTGSSSAEVFFPVFGVLLVLLGLSLALKRYGKSKRK